MRPTYPEIAQEAGIEGVVIVQAFIDKKGRVKETLILKGVPNTGLDEAAMEAIRKTRFRPAKQRERAVGVWISIPVNFKLK
ncbi:MAG: energy transducer TonB [Candidatus Neomarinimicrobiota bacterium]|nr:energy transducer TonB [Candidatus Neomarinimicrobiota bacterium]